jgi:phosphate-selective porin OprO/OprP
VLSAVLCALLCALTLDVPAPAAGPSSAAEVRVTARDAEAYAVDASDAAVPALEAQKAKKADKAKKGDGAEKPLRVVWRDHPSIRVGRKLRLDFAAKFQFDSRDPGDNPDDFPTYEVHRARVGVEGEVFRHIQFSVERELTEKELDSASEVSSKTPWKDVYVEADYTNAAQVRVGQMKIPFGLDETTAVSNLEFVYRSLGGRYLSPGYDRGVMVHGRFFHRGLNYWVGWFEHDGDNSRSKKIAGGDGTVAARVTGAPFRTFKSVGDVQVGGSFAVTSVSDESIRPDGLRGRTVLSQFTFFEPVFVKGTRYRYGVDLDWLNGPFGARAEYLRVQDQRKDQGLVNDLDLNDARSQAWYVLGSWVVTGEKKARPVEPKKGLLQGGVGALELSARFDRLWFNSKPGEDPPFRNSRAQTIYPSGDKVLTLGVTYYANRWVKLMYNAIREHAEDIERSPMADGSAFWSSVLRLQLQL